MFATKRAFTLIELLVVIAIIAILAAILFPVFAQAKDSAKQTACTSNTKQTALGGLMYSADFDDTLPRHDNNGSCLYGESPCNYPDWGDLRYPTGGTYKTGENVMYFGALQPYIKNVDISKCPSLGSTNWSSVISSAGSSTFGITSNNTYDKAAETFYYNSLGQMAINMLLIDYGPATGVNGRGGAAKGNLGRVARPSETIAFVAESAWDWGPSISANVGNGAVWPSNAVGGCIWSSSDGWTRYPHKGKSGNGVATTGTATRATTNPNLQGIAVFGFADGHAKAMKYSQSEKCTGVPNGTWTYSSSGASSPNYYPYWTPDL